MKGYEDGNELRLQMRQEGGLGMEGGSKLPASQNCSRKMHTCVSLAIRAEGIFSITGTL